MNDFLRNFEENYLSPPHPIAFSGINQIYSCYNGVVPKSLIKDKLTHLGAYNKHKETHRNNYNIFFIKFKRQQFQLDLIDVKDLKRWNDGITFLLVCIDVFTRKSWVIGLKNKTKEVTKEAFEKILSVVRDLPKTCYTDKGKKSLFFKPNLT